MRMPTITFQSTAAESRKSLDTPTRAVRVSERGALGVTV
jgi:hypothetical protein